MASQIVDRILKEEQLGMIIKNFKPEIRNGIGHQYFKHYKALMHMANETEEELTKAVETKKTSS